MQTESCSEFAPRNKLMKLYLTPGSNWSSLSRIHNQSSNKNSWCSSSSSRNNRSFPSRWSQRTNCSVGLRIDHLLMRGGTKAYKQTVILIKRSGNANGSSRMINPVARTEIATATSADRIARRCTRSAVCSSITRHFERPSGFGVLE